MRTKTIIPGFKNSDRIRIMLRKNNTEVGIYCTIKEMADTVFATTDARVAAWTIADRLGNMRWLEKKFHKNLTNSLLASYGDWQVQIDALS